MIDLQKLRFARAKKQMTQAAVAERVGITQTYYNRIERGERYGTINTILAICKVLDLQPSEVILNNDLLLQENLEDAGGSPIRALVPVAQEQSNEQRSEQCIVIERQEGNITVRYILPPTTETYEFLADQLNKPSLAEQGELPDKAVIVTNSGHHNRNSNNINIGAKK